MINSFVISKIFQALLLPPAILLLIISFGFLIIRRQPRIGRCFILTGFFLFYLLSIRLVSDFLILPLESTFPPFKGPLSINSASAVVILGGGVTDLSWLGVSPQPSRASLSRLIYGLTLYRQIPGSTLVISGGSGDFEKQNISEADAMKEWAIALGVEAKNIIVEKNSRNTSENATEVKRIIKDKKPILVTSAYHMKRAAAMFKKTGMDVTPAPTDYINERKGVSFYSFIPQTRHLLTSTMALSEYMSLIWYKLVGRI
ncbi:MAG: YdcF family protein [Deltaproteobacteria bacterium]|nr:YdcF family protein [Deltaproteobacteria bacterium]